MNNDCNGCETLNKLWDKAMNNTAIDTPSSYGMFTRFFSPFESQNIQWSMQIAALKCWEERTRNGNNVSFPPIVSEEKNYFTSSSSTNMNKPKASKSI